MAVTVLIPAYNPPSSLPELVRRLADHGLGDVVVVDDGSDGDSSSCFTAVAGQQGVEVLKNAVNLGKGAALKSGLNHIYNERAGDPEWVGVVTADADGQHRPEDILAVANGLEAATQSLVIGARGFRGEVPLRSRLGNLVTRVVFRLLIGQSMTDTQTGLRGLPKKLIPHLLVIRSWGYDFELDMLMTARIERFRLEEVPIETVYVDENKLSFFNPILDSAKIYLVFLRFMASSLVTAVVDYFVFFVVFGLSGSILFSQVLARCGAIVLNFFLARDFVFGGRDRRWQVFARFAALVVVLGAVSYSLIELQVRRFGIGVVPAKVAAELLVYFLNFATQRELVFQRNESS